MHLRHEWSDVNASFARMGVADGVAVHHTASVPLMLTYNPEYLRRIEHAEIALGYNALAYHTMWMDDGDCAESRPYFAVGAATGGHNGHTIAQCAVGYFHPPYNHVPSDAMVRKMGEHLYDCRQRGIITPEAIVKPHRWWTAGTQWATACCGDNFVDRVAEIEAISFAPPAPVTPRSSEDSMHMYVSPSFTPGKRTALFVQGNCIVREIEDYMNGFGVPENASNWRQSVDPNMPIQFLVGPYDGPAVERIRAADAALMSSGGGGSGTPGASPAQVREIVETDGNKTRAAVLAPKQVTGTVG